MSHSMSPASATFCAVVLVSVGFLVLSRSLISSFTSANISGAALINAAFTSPFFISVCVAMLPTLPATLIAPCNTFGSAFLSASATKF